MLVGLFLRGRFPTEKAYGITTIGTVRSLVKLKHTVYIFCLKSETPGVEIKGVQVVHYHENLPARALKFLALKGSNPLCQISWILFWKFVFYSNKNRITSFSLDIAWLRDLSMISFAKKISSVVIEVHQEFRDRELDSILRKLEKSTLVIAPISRIIESKLLNANVESRIVYSPMGLDRAQIKDTEYVHSFLNELKELRIQNFQGLRIGYVGKFAPNGYSKGTEDLLALALLSQNQKLGLAVSITGGTTREVLELKAKAKKMLIKDVDFEIEGHQSHKLALRTMASLHVIVLPAPTSNRYVGFPIKSLEAIATGRIVIAARGSIYKSIFSGEFHPYWYTPGSADSMLEAIHKATSDPSLERHLIKGLEFSKDYTWDKRTNTIIQALFNTSVSN